MSCAASFGQQGGLGKRDHCLQEVLGQQQSHLLVLVLVLDLGLGISLGISLACLPLALVVVVGVLVTESSRLNCALAVPCGTRWLACHLNCRGTLAVAPAVRALCW